MNRGGSRTTGDSITLRYAASRTSSTGGSFYGGSTTGGGSFVGSAASEKRRSVSATEVSAPEEGLLAGVPTGDELYLSPVALWGYLAQYFVVGLMLGGLPATTYGLLLGYLQVPSYVYATAQVVLVLPWSFKFLFGLVNDCAPLCGYRRKPYMCLGWSLCAIMMIVLYFMELPPPYHCFDDATKDYVRTKDGEKVPCDVESANKGGQYVMVMMLAATGYVVANVAADGLTVIIAANLP